MWLRRSSLLRPLFRTISQKPPVEPRVYLNYALSRTRTGPRTFGTAAMAPEAGPDPANGPKEDTTMKVDKQKATITEGKATIIVPEGAKVGKDKSEVQQVFYNPIQQFNRDLSVLAIKTYGEESLEKQRRKKSRTNRSKKRKRGQDEEQESRKTEGIPPASEDRRPEGSRLPFTILDALSASGLRALRYAHELPFVTQVVSNDLSPSAAESIKSNVEHNGLQDKITVNNDDALAVMYRSIADGLSKKATARHPIASTGWDVIDLDPYGTSAPFIDAAVQAVKDDGGLLAVTCTDSAIWAGHSYPEKTFSLYGGNPLKGGHSHEVGLRLILNAIATSAGRYGLDIEPLLSLSIDYYVKIFVRVTRSPQNVKFLGCKTMLAYTCDSGCGAWATQHTMKSKVTQNKKGTQNYYKWTVAQGPTTDEHCAHCGVKPHLTGPMYGGRLHNNDFIRRLLEQLPKADKEVYGTLPRLEAMLTTALEEDLPVPEPEQKVNPKEDAAAAVDPFPFYVETTRLAGVLSCSCPPSDLFKGALVYLGYRVTRSHCRAGSIKTDAPWSTIWWVMTEWIRQKAPVKPANIRESSPAYTILKRAGLLDETTPDGLTVQTPKANASTSDDVAESIVAEEGKGQGASADNVDTDATESGRTEDELRKTLVFDDVLARLGRQSGGKQIARYPMNPRENWGPLSKASKR